MLGSNTVGPQYNDRFGQRVFSIECKQVGIKNKGVCRNSVIV